MPRSFVQITDQQLSEAVNSESGQIVTKLMEGLEINVRSLSQKDRMRVIKMYLKAREIEEARLKRESDERIGIESNKIQSQQRDIAGQHVSHIRAKDTSKVRRQRTAEFRGMCSDIMYTGLLVMAAVGTHQVWSRGTVGELISQCGTVSASRGFWGMWGVWKSGEAIFCYFGVVGNAIAGLAVLFAAPWVLYRSGILDDYHKMPFPKLVVGLGLVCGFAGYVAVDRLGGNAVLWFWLWELWAMLHIIMSAMAHKACHFNLKTASGTVDSAPEALFESQDALHQKLLMWIVLGFGLPIVAAALPFSS